MLKFERHLNCEELRAACKEKGLSFDSAKYDRDGSDYVVIEGVFKGITARVFYSTVSGRFFGHTRGRIEFNSDRTTHDNKPWFKAILNLVYVSKSAEAA